MTPLKNKTLNIILKNVFQVSDLFGWSWATSGPPIATPLAGSILLTQTAANRPIKVQSFI